MKKYFLLLFVLNLMTSCGSDGLETNYSDHDSRSQLPDSDRTEEQGHLLKKVSHRNFGETEFLNDTEFEYDEQERFIKSISHEYANGSYRVSSQIDNEYDSQGRLLKSTSLEYPNGESEISSQSDYEYDSQGRLSKVTRQSNRASIYAGLTEAERLNLSGSITKYTYDQDVVIQDEYNLTNELRRSYHTFDISKNEHHREQYSSDSTLENTLITYTDDGPCSLIRRETIAEGVVLWRVDYEYLDANCSVRSAAYNDGKLSFEDTITRDSNNGIIELISRDPAGIIQKIYSYKNDITYNADNKPVNEVKTPQEGVKTEIVYEYY